MKLGKLRSTLVIAATPVHKANDDLGVPLSLVGLELASHYRSQYSEQQPYLVALRE